MITFILRKNTMCRLNCQSAIQLDNFVTILNMQSFMIFGEFNLSLAVLNKSSWKAHLSTANFWKTKQKWAWEKNKQPKAFSVLIRFWRTNRNQCSPINGQESGSSLYALQYASLYASLYAGMPYSHSWKKCFCLREPVFWGRIFLILRRNFPNME